MGLSTIIIIIITVVVITCMAKVLRFLMNYIKVLNQFKKFPSHPIKRYPFIGHSWAFVGEHDKSYETMIKVLKQVQARGDEMSVIWTGTVPVVEIVGPNCAEAVLHSSRHIQKPFFYDFMQPWLGTGLATSNGRKWKSRRKLLTPTFHFRILEEFLGVMNTNASKLIEKLEKYGNTKETFEISNFIGLCTLDIICETAMGKSINALDNEESEFVKATHRASSLIQERQKSPWLWSDFIFRHTKYGKKQKKCLSVLHNFTESVINERRQMQDSEDSILKNMAFLDMLLNVSDDDGEKLSLADIREEVDTFMFGGHDTTTAAASFALHLIGLYPVVQEKILKELHEVFGDDDTVTVTITNIKRLQYLEMVIKESMRLLSPVPIVARVTKTECEMNGHLIPAGTTCVIFLQLVNKNPKYWKEPESFDPERFAPENSIGRHPYSYLPFSAGPRNCIGQNYALIEVKVILAHILRKFSVVSCDKTEKLRLYADIIQRARDGINVRLCERKTSNTV